MLAAQVKVFPEGGALAADGDVTLFIPGVKSSGKVKYRNGDWSMSAVVGVSDLDIPFLKGGELRATYAKGAFSAQGKLDLALPGGGEGQLGLSYQSSRWLFLGKGKITHKRFGTVNVSLRDDGETFTATGKATFGLEKLGLTPEIDATFKKKRGEDGFKISGTGKLLINKGKLTGSLAVTLHETGKVSGEGKLSFPVRDNLTVEAGIVMDAEQKVTTSGIVKLTKPIDLFEAKRGSYKLTLFSLKVPVPGLSAGPIELQFGASAGIDAGYYFGPAQLKDVEVGAKLMPFEPDPDPILDFKGTLAIAAGAHLGFWVKGSLVLDVGLGSATGSIKVGGGVDAHGDVSLKTTAHYEKGWFEVGATASAKASLDLKFAVTAEVELTTILGDYGPGAKWEWELWGVTVPTGLGFEFSAPVSYHSLKGFTLPAPEQVTWKPPERIDAGDLLKRFLTAAKKSGGE